MAATGRTLEAISDLDTPAAVVINGAGIRSPLVRPARNAVENIGVAVAPVVYTRVLHVYAIAQGMTAMELDAKSKAAQEVTALSRWLQPRLQGNRSKR